MSRHALVERAEPREPKRSTSVAGRGTHALQQRADASERVARDARVQALADASRPSDAAGSDAPIQQRALTGLRGQAVALPHVERIQASFGHHDVSHVRAHLDAPARASCAAIGVQAFASGERVAFARAPSLFVAAHEAAHVVQQRSGIQLFGGVGRAGDVFEQHADEVAGKVVRGEPVGALLDRHAGPRGSRAAALQVQCWGEPDHYAMGQLAGVKALDELGHHDLITKSSPRLGDDEVAPTKARLLRGHGKSVDHRELAPEDTFMLRDDEGHPISYGAANRIGGDLSGQPLGKGVRAPTLAEWPKRLAEARAKAAAKAAKGSKKKSADSAMLLDDVDMPTDYAPLGKFGEYTLLATNANHFFPLARVEYQRQHQRAKQKMWMAIQLRDAGQVGADALARQAMLVEGFAGHFLADCFAAGHLSPHALGRIEHGGALDTGALVNTWHDLFNALPDGIPTTLGRFHGDYSMDGEDLEYVSSVLANSLLEVVMPWYTGRRFDPEIVLPEPDLPKIMADPVAGPLWAAMCKDYQPYLAKLAKLDRRKGKSGLSKYTIYASTTGEQVSNEEAIGPILEKTFGGSIELPERVLGESSVARTRGKVLKIVEALAVLLDYRGGWQPATGLAKDFEPIEKAPDVYKFRMDMKSAALASRSPATPPIMPLLDDLATWLTIWEQGAGLDEDAEEVELRERIGRLLELRGAAEKPEVFEASRTRHLALAQRAAAGVRKLPIEVDAAEPRYEQGPGSSLRRGKVISDLHRRLRSEHGDQRALELMPAELAKLPKSLSTSSAAIISLDVTQVRPLWRWKPDAAQALALLRGGLESLCADPRPDNDREHEALYRLLERARAQVVEQLGASDSDAPRFAVELDVWCEALAVRLADWKKLGTARGKQHETARREVLLGMSTLLEASGSPFTFDAEQLYRASGRKLGGPLVDSDDSGSLVPDVDYLVLS